MQTPIQMGAKEWTLMFVLAVIWAGSFIAVEIALTALPPFTIVMFRISVAAIALYLVIKASGIPLKLPSNVSLAVLLGAFLLLGLFNNVLPFVLIVWGQTSVDAGLASILNATMPFFTTFMAHVLTKDEKISLQKLVGITAGFIGVLIIFLPTISTSVQTGIWEQLAILGAACSYGFATIMGRRYIRYGLLPLHIAFGQLALAACVIIPIAMLFDKPWQLEVPEFSVWVALFVYALLCSALAYVLYFKLLQTAGATNVSFITLLVPGFAILLGVVLLGEAFYSYQGFGLAFITLGLLIMDGRIIKKIRIYS